MPPGRSAIDTVTIRGADAVGADDVADKIATAASEKFLGLFPGVVYDYEVFDPTVLQRDLARIERFYRGKGFLEAHARAARVEQVKPGHVRVEIVVDEGPPTLNRNLRVDGVDERAPYAASVRAAAAAALPRGTRFDETAYHDAKDKLKRSLTDAGFAYAAVEAEATMDLGARSADYVFTVQTGPPATFGAITIVGLDPDAAGPRPQEIDEAPLRRAINIQEGTPFSTAQIDAATQALLELEVFSAVQIESIVPDPPPAAPVIPLVVHVEPTRLRQVRLGFGAEFDSIKTDVHLLTGWEDHNFLGGLRDLSIDFRPGLVLYPLRLENVVPPNQLLPEERLKIQFRQPAFFEARTSGFVKPEFNVYPFLVEANPPPDQPVIGYVEWKNAIGADRPFGKFFVSLAYNTQVEVPFKYSDTNAIPPTIVLSYPQLITRLDLRDDPLQPHEGIYLSNDLQVAGGIFGGNASDVRVQPEARAYVPISRAVTWATRASVGFLFASNYSIDKFLPNENLTDPARTQDIETVYFRGFYSGGPNSNRGFPIRGIAPYGTVPFLLPGAAARQLACNPSAGHKFDPTCALPIGGFSLWEFSTEARVQISGPFSAAAFCDLGDVGPTTNLRLGHLHLSCGVGARYDTQVGPIRLDIGYRIQPLQVLGFPSETAAADPARGGNPVNGDPPDLAPGLPLAIAFGIGEAY